jgi:hypothetical protein
MRHRRLISLIIGVVGLLPVLAAHSETWSPVTFIPELNTSYRDLDPFLTADGKTLYFASDRAGNCSGCSDSRYGIDIYVSNWLGNHWSAPQKLPYPINVDRYWDGEMSLTLDGRYMYFCSNRPGTYGELDIYVSENIDGIWQTPVNLGPQVNSYDYDGNPKISPDGKLLIFDSLRNGGVGDADVYYTQKVNGVWQTALNIGAGINTSRRDDHPTPSYSGRYLFYTSNYDIYRSEKLGGVWQRGVKIPALSSGSYDVINFFLECDSSVYTSRQGSSSWDIGKSQWLDPPFTNPCSSLIIPDGQWRVRVTLLSVDASLKSDVYIDEPISDLLIKNSLKNVGKVVTTPFLSADELVFHLHINARSMGLGEYDHYSNSEFARVERVDPLRYIVSFEDLPADQADWDFNDVVLLVELVGEDVNIWESSNFLGESQLIEPTPVAEDTNLVLPLQQGEGILAQATVPAGGLTEASYSVLIEGDTYLYHDILADAPFSPCSTALKLELTNGQAATANGEPFTLAIDLTPSSDPEEDPRQLYWFNPDTSKWEKVASQYQPAPNQLVAFTTNVGLYAVGAPRGATLAVPAKCGLTGPASASLPYLLTLLPALALRLWGRKKN